MIGPVDPIRAPMDSDSGATAAAASHAAAGPCRDAPSARPPDAAEPILCGHCGRTASNGISCQGICVADSGY
jgi:hypothetical protein